MRLLGSMWTPGGPHKRRRDRPCHGAGVLDPCPCRLGRRVDRPCRGVVGGTRGTLCRRRHAVRPPFRPRATAGRLRPSLRAHWAPSGSSRPGAVGGPHTVYTPAAPPETLRSKVAMATGMATAVGQSHNRSEGHSGCCCCCCCCRRRRRRHISALDNSDKVDRRHEPAKGNHAPLSVEALDPCRRRRVGRRGCHGRRHEREDGARLCKVEGHMACRDGIPIAGSVAASPRGSAHVDDTRHIGRADRCRRRRTAAHARRTRRSLRTRRPDCSRRSLGTWWSHRAGRSRWSRRTTLSVQRHVCRWRRCLVADVRTAPIGHCEWSP